MVLFMSREDQGIQYLAAGNGRIIAEIGIDQSRAIFQLRIGGHNKTYGLYPIKYAATKTDNAIYQFTAFTDL